MKPVARTTFLVSALALAFAGPVAAVGEPHAHEHAGHDAEQYAKLDAGPGKQWPTDEPLRHGMDNIRTALASELAVLRSSRRPSAGEYAALAAWIEDEVAGIVQNCKLEPQADAQLHQILAKIAAGTEGMKTSGTRMGRRAAAQRVAEALGDYERVFEHPGWQKL